MTARSPRENHRTAVGAALGTAGFLVAAPGVVAGLVPWVLTGWSTGDTQALSLPVRAAGVALVASGVTVLLAAFVRFVREGLGTPAPVAPTERLVIGGLYRHVRNPMYLAVVAIITGEGLLLGRPVLLIYAAAVGAATATFAHLYEEPTLRRRFGAEYDAYRCAVPAWRPLVKGWPPHIPGNSGSPT
jgi:protein-S-isoprenylcysteine O-methyltransferase Ste14